MEHELEYLAVLLENVYVLKNQDTLYFFFEFLIFFVIIHMDLKGGRKKWLKMKTDNMLD